MDTLLDGGCDVEGGARTLQGETTVRRRQAGAGHGRLRPVFTDLRKLRELMEQIRAFDPNA